VHPIREAADTAATQLLVHDRFVSEVTADATVSLRYVQAQQASLTHELPGFAIDVMLCPPAGLMRHHFGLDEPGDRIAKRRQLIVHPV